MSEKQFILYQDDLGNYEIRYDDKVFHFLWEVAPILNEQQATINEYKKDNAKWRRKCLDLLVIIRTELLPRISDDEVKRLQKLIDDD